MAEAEIDDAEDKDYPLQEKWFVLNWTDGGANITENPKHECFDTERDAVIYAKECAKGPDANDGDIYHIMRSMAVVSSARRITVRMVKPTRKRA